MKRESKKFELNKPQGEVQLVKANTTWFIAGRGTGKTTGGIGPYLLDCVQGMPGATGIMVANSYEQMYTRTLPPVVAAWAEMGFREWDPVWSGHYVVGKLPPRGFARPYIPVLKPEKFIHWYNGTVIALISLAVKGSANALSVQFGSFDEVKFMKEEDVNEVNKVFRGNKKYFSGKSQYLSRFYATDKWADLGAIQWILNKKKLMDVQRVEVVKTLALRSIELNNEIFSYQKEQKECLKNGTVFQRENELLSCENKLKEIEKLLLNLRRNLVFYCESSAFDNVNVLGKKYFRDQKRDLSENEFNVAIKNLDPTFTEGPFYPDLCEQHFYDNENDCDGGMPLIFVTDYQHTIAPICVAQLNELIERGTTTLNFLNAIFTLEPKKLSDAVEKFCDEYESHACKEVFYVFDHTAIGEKADGEPDYKIVGNILSNRGWLVHETYTGQAPRHFTKYNRIADWLQGKNETKYPIRINRAKNASLKKSLELADTAMKSGKTIKVKKYEDTTKYPDFPQNEATHFSDVFDMTLWAVEELDLIRMAPRGFGVAFR